MCEIALTSSQTALKSLFLLYHRRLTRFIGIYISSPSDVEEVLSDTFIALWENRKNLMDVKNFNAYIYGIARFKAISFSRKKQIETVDVEDYPVDIFFRTETTPLDDIISREAIEKINAAINSLPERTRTTFKLIREDKLMYKDVAEILGISVKTVEAHMGKAIRKLREALRDV